MNEEENDFKIVVLLDRWVLWGNCELREDGRTVITNASVIRIWGTKRGLGELAAKGKRPDTELDPIGRVVVGPRDLKFSIDCAKDWGKV
ncbi:hypothetical protein MNBD_GAMMA15-1656 [hydrothermal vent metagenome]|uniref:Uncharacterized protein n=1 Tax=hydrothermal vent metagenome TaxID=652676 RepID=A0A3B0YUP0_9ZZZZ